MEKLPQRFFILKKINLIGEFSRYSLLNAHNQKIENMNDIPMFFNPNVI